MRDADIVDRREDEYEKPLGKISTKNRLILNGCGVVAFIVLANAVYWAAGHFYFLSRALFNIDYVLPLFLLAFGRRWLAVAVLIAVVAMDVVFSIAPAYHFSPHAFAQNFPALRELVLNASMPMFSAWLALALLPLLALCVFIRFYAWRGSSTVVLLACGVAMVVGDGMSSRFNVMSSTTQMLYVSAMTAQSEQMLDPDDHVPSASSRHDFSALVDAQPDNVLLIVLESFGALHDAAMMQQIISPLANLAGEPGVSVEVESGLVPFAGSTVPAELRELCGLKFSGTFPRIGSEVASRCLPVRMAEQGYRTVAIHGLSSRMFNRGHWYPQLGFDAVVFADSDVYRSARRCNAVFHGVCDASMLESIEFDYLSFGGGRNFIYWLTLSTHLPLSADDLDGASNLCDQVTHAGYSPAMCMLISMHQRFFENLARIVKDSHGSLSVIVVGDHSPPFATIEEREFFDQDHVPFIHVLKAP